MNLIARLVSFLRGDMVGAEDLAGYPPKITPPVAVRAATDAPLATYLVELARHTSDRADAVLTSVQTKASAFLTLVVAVLPFELGAAALLVPAVKDSPARWLAFGVAIVSVLLTVAAAIMASLASGLALTGSVNLSYMEVAGQKKTLGELQSSEIDAWNHAALLTLESSRRKASDLFRARQLLLLAVLVALVALAILAIAVRGGIGDILTPPATSPPK
jgi:hypothetical protein